MTAAPVKRRGRLGWPGWVWVVILALAATQPLIHVWLAYFPPEGTVSTGLDILDSAVMIYSMRMFRTGLESLYATCQSPYGAHYAGYYPLPFQWLYGAFGLAADGLGANHFLFYGLINGVGMFLYLAAACVFLREVVPKHANVAFLLFALSGGLGGLAYVVTGILGLHTHPQFEAYFFRFAMYELIEGSNCLPIGCQPRFYYTAALGLCLGGLTALIRASRSGREAPAIGATILMLLGAGINLRYGAFAWAIAVIFLWCQGDRPLSDRVRLGVLFTMPLILAGLLTRLTLSKSPVLVLNAASWSNVATWFSAFLSVMGLHLVTAPREAGRRLDRLPPFARACAFGAAGYLMAFAILYCCYQVYWGNLLKGRDFRAAVVMSDWALIGAVLGMLYAWRRPAPDSERDEHDWIVLWFLAFTAVTISAFGQGWFLRFGPQRLQALLWLPICILSALGLARLKVRRPRLASGLTAALVLCGLSSILVAVLCFQGPLSFDKDGFPYAYLHAEVMTQDDARTMDALGDGRVLAPASTSDAIVLRRGNPVMCGVGSFNLTDQPYLDLRAEVSRFFAVDATEGTRRRVVTDWCVDYVFCPDTQPVSADTVEQLRVASWLHEVAAEGRAVLFKVVME